MKVQCDITFSEDRQMTVEVALEYAQRFLDAINHKWDISFPANKALQVFMPLSTHNMSDASAGLNYLKSIIDDVIEKGVASGGSPSDHFLDLDISGQPTFYPLDDLVFVGIEACFS